MLSASLAGSPAQRPRLPATPWRWSIALTLALLCFVPDAQADWRRGEAIDPDTGDALDAVIGLNERGHSLMLARDPHGSVRAIFKLPVGDRDFLDQAEPPRISIDGGPQRQVPLAGTGLTWAAFPVWNGSGEALTGLLRELMQGETIEVTYFLNGGGYKETSFSLDSARTTIAEAFGLRSDVSAEEIREAVALEEALLVEAERCGAEKGKKRDRCLDALRACVAEARDATELRDCLGRSGSRS
ncbi:MAG TPA: hypothetical protein VNB06_14695 [Thermoanaerobaculia bacterium]|nr:hypothetical protein [Thermoanaerobaculia bacterium]